MKMIRTSRVTSVLDMGGKGRRIDFRKECAVFRKR